jgi:hypothetical protein
VSKKYDQVFPTSLSEIAFTLVFLLMLLLGYMILMEQKEKTELQRRLAGVRLAQSSEAAKVAMEKAKAQFEAALAAAGHPSPIEVAARLVAASDVQAERDRLRAALQDLTERMSALEALRERIDRAGAGQGEKVIQEELERALHLQEKLRQIERDPEKNNISAVKAENEKLRGQIQYFTNRDKLRGLDHPPCWADTNGKIEFLFNVETRPDGFITTKAWPANRELEARSLPNLDGTLSSGLMTPTAFSAAMQPILDWSKQQEPECRHFVYLATTIGDADARDTSRKLVEGFFYKLEVKR